MALPTTAFSAHVLLILSFLALGLWSGTFKLVGARWRFELFSFDFAIGTVLLAFVTALTLGSVGTDLGISEQLMVASRTSQAFAFGSGCAFALGNMMLLAAISLLGFGFAYGVATSVAVLVLAGINFAQFRAVFLLLAVFGAITTIFFEVRSARSADKISPPTPAAPARRGDPRKAKAKPTGFALTTSTKGILVAALGGLSFGMLITPFSSAVFGDFTVGPFAGLLLFSLGALTATFFLTIYFMNVAIQGGRLSLKSYISGGIIPHLFGVLGGVLCAGGILATLMACNYPRDVRPDRFWLAGVPLGASILASVLGLTRPGRPEAAKTRARAGLFGVVSLAITVIAFGWAMSQSAPPVTP